MQRVHQGLLVVIMLMAHHTRQLRRQLPAFGQNQPLCGYTGLTRRRFDVGPRPLRQGMQPRDFCLPQHRHILRLQRRLASCQQTRIINGLPQIRQPNIGRTQYGAAKAMLARHMHSVNRRGGVFRQHHARRGKAGQAVVRQGQRAPIRHAHTGGARFQQQHLPPLLLQGQGGEHPHRPCAHHHYLNMLRP